MKLKINLDTLNDVKKFVEIANKHPDTQIFVEDGGGARVSAHSMMGMLYSLEFHDMWLVAEKNIYSDFSQFEAE